VNTFNYFQWRTLELIEKLNKLTIKDIPITILKELCYVQLPTGESLINKICKNQQEVSLLFSRVQAENTSKHPFYIPIFSYFVPNGQNLAKYSILDDLYGAIEDLSDFYSSSKNFGATSLVEGERAKTEAMQDDFFNIEQSIEELNKV